MLSVSSSSRAGRDERPGAKRHRGGTCTALLRAVTSAHARVCLVTNRIVAILWQGCEDHAMLRERTSILSAVLT